MKTITFTFLQLISLLDGRLSTSIDDVQNMLGHIFDTTVLTHEVPDYIRQLNEINPVWLKMLREEYDTLMTMYEGDFMKVIEVVKADFNFGFDIPQIK